MRCWNQLDDNLGTGREVLFQAVYHGDISQTTKARFACTGCCDDADRMLLICCGHCHAAVLAKWKLERTQPTTSSYRICPCDFAHRLKPMEGDELHKVGLQILCSFRSYSVQLAQEGADDEEDAQQALSTPPYLLLSRCWVGGGHFEVGPQAASEAGWIVGRHAESHICQTECM